MEGIATIVLLCDARAEDERKRVVLASLLDIDDDKFRDLMPFCSRVCQCRMLELRDCLRTMVESERCRRRAA